MTIPSVKFGEHNISRLIIGGNPISGFSHISESKDKEMKDYHSVANVKSIFDECITHGINTLQARGDENIIQIIQEYCNDGKNIQWIAQTASEIKDLKSNLRQIVSNQPIAIFHHGTHTDNLWHTGSSGIKQVQDNLKRIRNTGIRTGLGTHRPDVIEYAETHEWDVDFYMTSFYNLAKEYKHIQAKEGFKEENFEDKDIEQMLRMVNQTKKQCLVFKILGAGRKTKSHDELKSAFDFAFQNIKPQDCVVVGMFQKHKNQVSENAKIVEDVLRSKI